MHDKWITHIIRNNKPIETKIWSRGKLSISASGKRRAINYKVSSIIFNAIKQGRVQQNGRERAKLHVIMKAPSFGNWSNKWLGTRQATWSTCHCQTSVKTGIPRSQTSPARQSSSNSHDCHLFEICIFAIWVRSFATRVRTIPLVALTLLVSVTDPLRFSIYLCTVVSTPLILRHNYARGSSVLRALKSKYRVWHIMSHGSAATNEKSISPQPVTALDVHYCSPTTITARCRHATGGATSGRFAASSIDKDVMFQMCFNPLMFSAD